MRLLSKTSLLILTISIFIFFVGNIVFFMVTKQMINSQVNSELNSLKLVVVKNIDSNPEGISSNNISDIVKVSPIAKNQLIESQLTDTVIYNTVEMKFVPHRKLVFTHANANENFKVEIYKSLIESDIVVERITISSILLVIIFVISIYFINKFIFESVWKDFFSTIDKIEKYNIHHKENLILEKSEIVEFDRLNTVLLSLVDRIKRDFVNLKELTANTSHEIQTPIAIIRSKAEILLQSEQLSENEVDLISSILSTAERLSKLNQSLLLIAKIENDQFGNSETIDIWEVIEKYVENFDILFSAGEYAFTKTTNSLYVKFNPILLDILVSNLLKNALTHNEPGGKIIIELDNNKLTIKNSGAPLKLDANDIFKRFVKDNTNKNNSGLGLEIVRKICDYYGIAVNYSYQNQLHCFVVDFVNVAEKI